ncbi:MAG: hypothetical protein GX151_14415 [Gammaproteobacteria bacterium]|nr:hypothetical protein [Gammaproteobacteria bacterium]
MENNLKETGRRQFFKEAAALGVMGTIGGGYLLSSCNQPNKKKSTSTYEAPVFPEKAPDGKVLKAGLIGCGGRGTGAAVNFINAGPNLLLDRTPEQFEEFLRSAIVWMDQNPEQTTRERLITLYAWNELGEGGYLVPTKGDPEASYLKIVKKITSEYSRKTKNKK